MTFDRHSTTTKPTAHVGGDSYDQAKTTAEAFVALLKSKGVQGKCIELQGDLVDINAVNRSKAWHAVTDGFGSDHHNPTGADPVEPGFVPLRHGERAARPSRGELHVPGKRLRLAGDPVGAGECGPLRQDRRSQACLDR